MGSIFHRIDVAASNEYVFQKALSNDGLFYTTYDSNQRIFFGSTFNSNQDPAMIVHGTKATTEITRLQVGYEDDMIEKHGMLDTNRTINFLRGDLGNGSNSILDWFQYHGGGSNSIADMDYSKDFIYVIGTYGSNIMRLYNRININAQYTLPNSNILPGGDASSVYIAAYDGSNGAYVWSTSITTTVPSHLQASAIRATPQNDRFYITGIYEPQVGEIRFKLEENSVLTLTVSEGVGASNGSFLTSYTYQKDDADNFPDMEWLTLLPGQCRDLDANENWILATGNNPTASNAYVRAFLPNGTRAWNTEFSSNNVIPYAVRIQECSQSVYVATREGFGQTGLYTFGLSNGTLLRPPQFIHTPAAPSGYSGITPLLDPKSTYMTFDVNCDLYILDSFNQSISVPISPAPYTIDPYESNSISTQDILLTKMNTNGDTLWYVRGSGHGHDAASCVYTSPYGDVYFTGHFQNKIDLYDGFGAFHESIARESSSNSAATDAVVVCKLSRHGHFVYANQIEGVSRTHPVIGMCDTFGNVYLAGTQAAPVLTFPDPMGDVPKTLMSRVQNAFCEGFIIKYDHDSYYYLLEDEFRGSDTGIELSFYNAPAIPNSQRRCFVSLGTRPNPATPVANVDPYTLAIKAMYQVYETTKLSLTWYGGYWRTSMRDVTGQNIMVNSLVSLSGWGGTGSVAGPLGGLISTFTAAADPIKVLGFPKYFSVGDQLHPPIFMPYTGYIMAVTGYFNQPISSLPGADNTWFISFAIRELTSQRLSTLTEDGLATDSYVLTFSITPGQPNNDRLQIGRWGQSPRVPYKYLAGSILVWEVIDIRGTIPLSLPILTAWTQFA